MKKLTLLLCIPFILISCTEHVRPGADILPIIQKLDSIEGKTNYLNSPFLTAGDRLYMVGHQDGTFPDLGWHVKGEMGGIWDHPIKLMDGFILGIGDGSNYWCLTDAHKFVNYPMANLHQFSAGANLRITRVQFVPDGIEGMIVEYTITNVANVAQVLTLNFTGMVDLTPVWLADNLNVHDGVDQLEFLQEKNVWIAKDSLNDWFTVFATNDNADDWKSSASQCSFDREGKGKDASISSEMSLEAKETKAIRYFIAGSYKSKEEALATYQGLSEHYDELLQAKVSRYEKIKNTAQIDIPNEGIEELYIWTKYNTDWLMRDVPEQGRGLSAGIPDYPWWFGTDAGYALRGLLATGQHAEVKATIQLIQKLSDKNNGRIMHEASTNGVVFNPGNLNTTPYFIYLLWEYYKWTGDKELLKASYPQIQRGLEWLMSQDKDGNGYPNGAGMMEIHGLHSEMIDVAVYTEAAFGAAGAIALELGDQQSAAKYISTANDLAKKINEDWWVESANSFADFQATKEQTLTLIDAAIIRADTINKPWAIEELKATRQKVQNLKDNDVQGHVVYHNWVVNTPMEFGIASTGKAEKALETARKYSNRFGLYVTGIDRDEKQNESSKWKSFSYVGAVMTLPTGVQAIAEANYGHMDHALEYLEKLRNSFSYALPGSMYEVSPDYGMMAQAWNIYAVAVPIINHFFGAQPMAHEKAVSFQPQLPSGWNDASLDSLMVGDNAIGFTIKGNTYTFTQSKPDWQIVLILKDKSQKVFVNEQEQDIRHSGNYMHIRLTGELNVVRLEKK